MFTISDILADIQRGITANNLNEDYFSYRLIYFVNSENGNKKYYVDASYGNLRAALETIIRKNLTVTNTVVVAQTTVRKDGKSICLQSRAYSFNLSEYFRKVCDGKAESISTCCNYGRRIAQWC